MPNRSPVGCYCCSSNAPSSFTSSKKSMIFCSMLGPLALMPSGFLWDAVVVVVDVGMRPNPGAISSFRMDSLGFGLSDSRFTRTDAGT